MSVTADMIKDEVEEKPQRVIVTNLDMEFGTMIWFMVKLAFAAISRSHDRGSCTLRSRNDPSAQVKSQETTMCNEAPKTTIVATLRYASDEARLSISETVAGEVYQFIGLLWATEHNAYYARLESRIDSRTVYAMNALLTAYAALEALVLETTLCIHPALYADKDFRKAGIIKQYTSFLESDERDKEEVSAVVAEISRHRVALTHSEPDNRRTHVLGQVISGTDAVRFAREIRNCAEWLWRGRRPSGVASAFDQSNGFMKTDEYESFLSLDRLT